LWRRGAPRGESSGFDRGCSKGWRTSTTGEMDVIKAAPAEALKILRPTGKRTMPLVLATA